MNPPGTLLVQNGTFLTMDPALGGVGLVRGNLVARDGVIEAVGPDARAPDADEVLDASGCVVTPGLVNAHTHSAMTLLRGVGDDLPLEEWLRSRIWPLEAKLTEEDVRAGSGLAVLEMLAAGVTAFNDMYFFADATADVVDASGMRAVVGATFLDFATPEMRPDAMIDHARGFVERWGTHARVHPALAPHSTYTCGPGTLDAVRELRATLADAVHGRAPLLHTHCAETRGEVQGVEAEHGARPLILLEKHGLVSEGTVLAHCGWITKAEAQAIGARGAAVAHCPVSNMKLATGGWLPFPELDAAGVRVGLGTDGAASNNTLDVLEAAKFACLGQKQHRWDARALTAERALQLATRDGAAALGLQRVGVLAPGWACDLAVVDLTRPGLRPLHDAASQLVYAARGTDVKATIVAGRVLYEDGTFLALDADRVVEDASRAAERLTRDASTV